MRTAFIKELTELAEKDKNVYLITADTGFKVFDEYQKTFPDRYLNIGISESAMISVACGLALNGKNVFVYGIVPFVVMRCFEQIRNDLCMQNLPVKIVGVGGGLVYGGEGATHHSIEDIAIMNSLPNMSIVCPGDPIETAKAVRALADLKGPVYLRLGKSREEVIHRNEDIPFNVGKGILVREGKGVAIITTGNMLQTGAEIHDVLKTKGIEAKLVSMHTIKPIDRKLIIEIGKKCKIFFTLEEHSTIGGLGSCIANVITEENLSVTLKKFAVCDKYAEVAGSHSYLRDHFGLTTEKILEKLLPSLDLALDNLPLSKV